MRSWALLGRRDMSTGLQLREFVEGVAGAVGHSGLQMALITGSAAHVDETSDVDIYLYCDSLDRSPIDTRHPPHDERSRYQLPTDSSSKSCIKGRYVDIQAVDIQAVDTSALTQAADAIRGLTAPPFAKGRWTLSGQGP